MNLRVQRIYDYRPDPADGQIPVLADRLYPRGIAKEKLAGVVWLKDIAPSTALRRRYHAAPEAFDEFAVLYLEELQAPAQQAALEQLKIWAQERGVLLLTAVKNPRRSHISVLLDYLGIAPENAF